MSELWVVAAGTGGHIFPGVEVAKEIQKIDPDISPLFFGTKNRLEAQIIPEQGLNFISIPAAPWKGKSPIGKIWGLCLILFSTIILCLRALKSPPKACLCVGGYVSLPIALVARLFKKPVFLIEPNIEAGAANKLISKWAQKAYCAPKSNVALQLQCRCEEFGIPTRKHSFPYEIRNKVRKILFLGGSQGAQSVNNAAIYCIPDLYKDDPEIQFTIQCGKSHEDEDILHAEKLSMSKNVQVKGFINQIT